MRDMDRARRSLPIFAYREDVLNAIALNQLVIVAGDTGCGKSTQVAILVLLGGWKYMAYS